MASPKAVTKRSRGQQEPPTFETAYSYHGIDFEKLFDDGPSDPELEELFFKIMEAFDGLSEDNLSERTRELAKEAQKAHCDYTARVAKGRDPDTPVTLWDFWRFYVLMVKCVPYRHIGHRLVTEIVLELEKIGKTENPTWEDLPELGETTREEYLDPTNERVVGDDFSYTLEQWLNFNSWLARLIGSGSERGLNFVVWSIARGLENDLDKLEEDLKMIREKRKAAIEEHLEEVKAERAEKELRWRQEQGLEGQPQSPEDKELIKKDEVVGTDAKSQVLDNEAFTEIGKDVETGAKMLCPEAVTRVAVAAEFFIQAAPVILKQSLTWYDGDPVDDSTQRVFRAGPLFPGTFGFNLERWGFWKRRLGELRSLLGDEEVEKNVDEALGKMSAVEVSIARHL
ncbi:hypothetical protein CGCSCA4_v005517 [Colletotrichum siamense]|uniref:Uncharacterized protein n=1 Tax=Colletotrichum siamense TaxID=690259 RepID=A0A9P5EUE6_COLSI|nr:hypothetical protein CGCSCA4_v005517 [Colletotrichum siamense]KAF4860223.1 hypothetical protein CGCSCA2_v005565 [Colletotrichum siamense]